MSAAHSSQAEWEENAVFFAIFGGRMVHERILNYYYDYGTMSYDLTRNGDAVCWNTNRCEEASRHHLTTADVARRKNVAQVDNHALAHSRERRNKHKQY